MPPAPLPQGFSKFEHLQGMYRKVMNKLVKDEFSDVDDNDLDLALPRHSLKYACLHLDDDSVGMTQMRESLFFLGIRKGRDLHPPLYYMPMLTLQERVYFHPQIELYFEESTVDAEKHKRRPLEAVITFRLMGETETTITQAEINKLALKIKQLFATPRETIKKGNNIYSYTDVQNGYRLKLYSQTKVEAERVIKQVLEIQNHTYNSQHLNVNTPDKPSTSERKRTKKVLGETIKQRAFRPKGLVKFKYASLKLHGLNQDIILVDTTNRHFAAIERV